MIATMPASDLVDTIVEDERWEELNLEALSKAAATATLKHLTYDPQQFEICVMGCNDARIADLNSEFREKPAATNVLSWPSEERVADQPGGTPAPPGKDLAGMPVELGDIAISYETCLSEAHAAAKSPKEHVTHLIVHGVLHLLGYDHICEEDAALMEGLEKEILAELGIADPYNI